ncbi:MAG: hypothetical protein ACI97A_003925 [Planctomycetota bacterium]|jgi:hypothetical protein
MVRMIVALLCLLTAVAHAQLKGEAPDVYEFAPALVYKPKYKHDEKRKKIILNPDFFCSQCAKEGRIKHKHRDELKQVLEMTKKFPIPMDNGEKERRHGRFRLMDRPAGPIIDFLMKQKKTKSPVFIEDRTFRIFCDLPGFSTKKYISPRREIELEQLHDIFPKVSKKTVTLNPHQRAHLYLIRAHRILRDFKGLAKADAHKKDMAFKGPYIGMYEKFEIYIFQRQENMLDFIKSTLGSADEDGRCWHNLKDASMSAILHSQKRNDFELNNTFTHRMAYNIITGYRKYQYDLPTWVALGYAHLMERRERTDFNTYLLGEQRLPKFPTAKKWKVKIRKLIVSKKVPRSFAEIAAFEKLSDVVPIEHFMVWSQMSFLMNRDQEKMGKFINILKDKKTGESTRNLVIRALRIAYGLSIPVMEEQWKEWVLSTYPSV